MSIRWKKAVTAGVVGTAAMTATGLWAAPVMGIPAMNPAAMLAGVMGGSLALGWAAHLMIGVVLAFIYTVVAPVLPGSAAARGALYGLAPWLLAQLVVMPMMGAGLFSGSLALAAGSMVGHVVYGAIVGAVYAGVVRTRGAHPRPATA